MAISAKSVHLFKYCINKNRINKYHCGIILVFFADAEFTVYMDQNMTASMLKLIGLSCLSICKRISRYIKQIFIS